MNGNLIPIRRHFTEMEEQELFRMAKDMDLLGGRLKTPAGVSSVLDVYLTKHETNCKWSELADPDRGGLNPNVCKQRGQAWIRSGAMEELLDHLRLSPTFPYDYAITRSPMGQKSLRLFPRGTRPTFLDELTTSNASVEEGAGIREVPPVAVEPTIIDEGDALTLIDNLSDDCMVSLLEKHGGVLIDSVSDITVTVEGGKVRAKNCTWEFTTGVSALRDPNFIGMIEARM
ncbi:hypothetical protein RPALISO_164 [Ruegeria phage RpAliso]|nr:hypothetical protein RPALISO_164 [Ruegeria phage RpAliso]